MNTLAQRRQRFSQLFSPSVPLVPPVVDSDIENLPMFYRITEALTYLLLSFEYWISPQGGLRQWSCNCLRWRFPQISDSIR